jgi:hypothetical protein
VVGGRRMVGDGITVIVSKDPPNASARTTGSRSRRASEGSNGATEITDVPAGPTGRAEFVELPATMNRATADEYPKAIEQAEHEWVCAVLLSMTEAAVRDLVVNQVSVRPGPVERVYGPVCHKCGHSADVALGSSCEGGAELFII